MKIWAGSASTTPLLERPAQSRWYRHMVAAGLCALLYPWPEVAVAGGALFGVGVVWWGLGRYYEWSLKAWWTDV